MKRANRSSGFTEIWERNQQAGERLRDSTTPESHCWSERDRNSFNGGFGQGEKRRAAGPLPLRTIYGTSDQESSLSEFPPPFMLSVRAGAGPRVAQGS